MAFDMEEAISDIRAKALRQNQERQADATCVPELTRASALLLLAWIDQVRWESEDLLARSGSDEVKARVVEIKEELGDTADYVVSGCFSPPMIARLRHGIALDATHNMSTAQPLWLMQLREEQLGYDQPMWECKPTQRKTES